MDTNFGTRGVKFVGGFMCFPVISYKNLLKCVL